MEVVGISKNLDRSHHFALFLVDYGQPTIGILFQVYASMKTCASIFLVLEVQVLSCFGTCTCWVYCNVTNSDDIERLFKCHLLCEAEYL